MENSQINLILTNLFLTLICALVSSTVPVHNEDRFNVDSFRLEENSEK